MNEQPTCNERALAPTEGAVAPAGTGNPLVRRAISDLKAVMQPAQIQGGSECEEERVPGSSPTQEPSLLEFFRSLPKEAMLTEVTLEDGTTRPPILSLTEPTQEPPSRNS